MDGFFYMSFEAYLSHFKRTGIVPDVANNANWHSAKFLVTEDDGKKASAGRTSWCGPECYNHKFAIKSEVA